METLQELEKLKGKHIKQALLRLEKDGLLTPKIRKIVLDEVNDLMREVERLLGYTVED
jgi:hypothetical protein